MRRVVIICGVIISAVAVMIESGVVDALVVFLLSGSLPGTSIVLSPSVMMFSLVAASWLILTRITALGAINLVTVRRFLKRHIAKQERMPKRRYSRI